MKEKVWRSKGSVFFSILIVLLPFAQFFINGLTAIALTNDSESNVRQLFDNEYGKASLSYQTNENEIIWQLNIDKESATKVTQFLFSLKDKENKSILPTLSEENQATDHFAVISKEAEKDYATVFERKPSNTDKNYKIEFSTPVVSALTFKVAFNAASDQTNEQTTLFTKEYPISIKENDGTQTSTEETVTSATKESNDGSPTESSATGEETTSEVKDLGDADEATVNSAKKEAEKKYEETGVPQKITRSAAVLASDSSAGSLVISDKVFNDPSKMEVSVTGVKPEEIVKVPISYDSNGKPTNIENYDNYSQNETKVSSFYLVPEKNPNGTRPVSGKVNIKFSNDKSQDALSKAEVNVTYPKVGYINDQDGNLKEIGVKLTIKNIQRSPSPKNWTGYPFQYPSIDLSSNLFSGTVITGISSAEWNFTFFYVDNSEEIDFSSVANGYMSFNSLNGYGPNGTNGEFVKASDNRTGSVVENSIIKKGIVSTVKGQNFELSFQDVYYGTSDGFKDYLGSEDFNKASVKFDLKGTTNTFKLGTGGGAGHRAWFTFASSAIVPVKQKAPSKTVQPINQYKDGDSWDQPSGEPSGWNQRFWNDLDRSNDGTGEWSLLPQYRVEGHDADTDNLKAGIPKKADRYVKTGQKYYYYINQPTINLASQGLVLPTGYQIIDQLPAGVEIDNSDSKSLTLYDLKGNDITDTRQQLSIDKGKFELKLSSDQVNIINQQSKESATYGADFSVRVRVVVTNTTTDEIDDLMTNAAKSLFSYDSDTTFTATSNSVQTRVKSPIKPFYLFLRKIDSTGLAVAGAEFTLSGGNLENDLVVKSDEEGNINFNTHELIAGQTYMLQESGTPLGYLSSDKGPWKLVISEDGKSATLTDMKNKKTDLLITNKDSYNLISFENNKQGIVNTRKALNIQLKKKDTSDSTKAFTKNELSEAKFIIHEDIENGEETEAVIDENGTINFFGLDWTKKYVIEETHAPAGYIKLDNPIMISFERNGNGKLIAEIKGLDTLGNPIEVNETNDKFELSFNVPNKPKVPLPATGGIGVWLIYGAGITALIVGVGYYFLRNKSKGEA